MQESPCKWCGVLVRHTDDDKFPLCDKHRELWDIRQAIWDIADGKLKVPDREPDA